MEEVLMILKIHYKYRFCVFHTNAFSYTTIEVHSASGRGSGEVSVCDHAVPWGQ